MVAKKKAKVAKRKTKVTKRKASKKKVAKKKVTTTRRKAAKKKAAKKKKQVLFAPRLGVAADNKAGITAGFFIAHGFDR